MKKTLKLFVAYALLMGSPESINVFSSMAWGSSNLQKNKSHHKKHRKHTTRTLRMDLKDACVKPQLQCDDQTFEDMLPSFVEARLIAQKKKLNLDIDKDLKVPKITGKASCYANTKLCQGSGIDGYAYKETASGLCANPEKFTAAVDVDHGDPIYKKNELGAVVMAENNGVTTIYVTSDRGNMNKHNVQYDLVERTQNELHNERMQTMNFYGLKEPFSNKIKRKTRMKLIQKRVDCATQFNNTFDSDPDQSLALTQEQIDIIEQSVRIRMAEINILRSRFPASQYAQEENVLPWVASDSQQ